VEDSDVARGQAGEAEHGQPLGQADQFRLLLQASAGRREPLGAARHADPLTQAPPQLGLPARFDPGARARKPGTGRRRIVAGRPGQYQLGTAEAVTVKQPCDLTDVGEAAFPAPVQMAGQRGQPRLVDRVLDRADQRPDQALGAPGVLLGVDATRGGQRAADQSPGKRELDVGAYPVAAG
jgi:hypothetical protein